MTKNIIDGLTQYNSSGFRQCPKYHLRFIKALLIGLIGREKLAANQLDELVIEFIRGKWIFSQNYLMKTHNDLKANYYFYVFRFIQYSIGWKDWRYWIRKDHYRRKRTNQQSQLLLKMTTFSPAQHFHQLNIFF